MESYIVRILRRSSHNAEEIMGFVERPELEVKEPFRNFVEFVSIFSSHDAMTPRKKTKQVAEQRKHRRFLMKEGTVIFDSTTDIGEVTDISMGGLSFTSSDMVDDCPEVSEIDILCGDKSKTLRNVLCRRISHHEPPGNVALRYPETVRRFSLAFDNLTIQQKSQLETIIQDCTLLEV